MAGICPEEIRIVTPATCPVMAGVGQVVLFQTEEGSGTWSDGSAGGSFSDIQPYQALYHTPPTVGSNPTDVTVTCACDSTSASCVVRVYAAPQITTTSLPNGDVGDAYDQALVKTGGRSSFVWTLFSGSLPPGLTLNSSTGHIAGTPTVGGYYTFTVRLTDANGLSFNRTLSIGIEPFLVILPAPPVGECLALTVGQSIQFTATGGSDNYIWTISNGNSITALGYTTILRAGDAVVTVADGTTGQSASISICVTSQANFCVEAVTEDVGLTPEPPCSVVDVQCGDSIALKVAGFHVAIDNIPQDIQYRNVIQGLPGEAARLLSLGANCGANANILPDNSSGYFSIATSFDMAQTGNGAFAIGWSSLDAGVTVASIEHAVVWRTQSSVRYIELQHNGVYETGSRLAVVQGDTVSFGRIDGKFRLYLNGVERFVSEKNAITCGSLLLDISIVDANKSIGGFVENLTWSIVNAGTPSTIGYINATGTYIAPSSPIIEPVILQGTVNNAQFRLTVRTIKPSPMLTSPNAFLVGRTPHVWVTRHPATDNLPPRIAYNGSPDAIQNPGMIWLGTLEASATFTEDIGYQNFDNDLGTFHSTISTEAATLEGSFMEVRDFDKLATLMPHATLFPKVNGVRELAVGGKGCQGCELRVMLILQNEVGGYDVLYLPKVQNQGNLTLEVGRKAAGKYPLKFKALPDYNRGVGRQLYSIYQIDSTTAKRG